MSNDTSTSHTTLVLGGTGKTGRRVARAALGPSACRPGSARAPARPRSTGTTRPPGPAPAGRRRRYVAYYPDLAFPGAAETIGAFAARPSRAASGGWCCCPAAARRRPRPASAAVQDSGADWTILRASWFAQNFSEHFLLEPVLDGVIALPAGDVAEPFVDVDDIADVAVAALTDDGHAGAGLRGDRARGC